MALSVTSFDELNKLVGYKVSEPFPDYFRPMRLSQNQKRKRIALAEELEDVFIELLSAQFYAQQYGASIYTQSTEKARKGYISALSKLFEPDLYLMNHADEIVASVLLVLYRNADDPYYYSADRARALAEGESNSVWNHNEFEEAVKSGKHYKKWNTIIDGRERDSHHGINGTTLPINQPFDLPGGLMQYPRDTTYAASMDEIANCRCSLSFF